MDDTAIKVTRLSKIFKLPHEKVSTLKSALISFKSKPSYELQQVLDNVSFEIKKGEFFGIVGRNGSGKSTLLKLLAGIYSPTSGTLDVRGKLTPFIELGVGFNPELTGRENVYLNGALLGFDRDQMSKMYKDIVEFAELERFMDQKLKNYSSGMEVRLAFSIAVQVRSDILLIDEVLAVGDADFQRKCFNFFKTLKREKRTVVFVSHDMNAIREFCDKAVLIDNGEIKAIGSASEVAREYSELFMEKEEITNNAPPKLKSKRWGNGDVKIKEVKVSLIKDEVVVKCSVSINRPVDKLIYGLHIIGSDGQEVTAMNNRMIQAPDIVAPEEGSELSFEWRMLNVFNDGKYSVTLTIIDSAANTLDWLTQAAEFTVKRAERSTTAVLPPVSVKSKVKD